MNDGVYIVGGREGGVWIAYSIPRADGVEGIRLDRAYIGGTLLWEGRMYLFGCNI